MAAAAAAGRSPASEKRAAGGKSGQFDAETRRRRETHGFLRVGAPLACRTDREHISSGAPDDGGDLGPTR